MEQEHWHALLQKASNNRIKLYFVSYIIIYILAADFRKHHFSRYNLSPKSLIISIRGLLFFLIGKKDLSPKCHKSIGKKEETRVNAYRDSSFTTWGYVAHYLIVVPTKTLFPFLIFCITSRYTIRFNVLISSIKRITESPVVELPHSVMCGTNNLISPCQSLEFKDSKYYRITNYNELLGKIRFTKILGTLLSILGRRLFKVYIFAEIYFYFAYLYYTYVVNKVDVPTYPSMNSPHGISKTPLELLTVCLRELRRIHFHTVLYPYIKGVNNNNINNINNNNNINNYRSTDHFPYHEHIHWGHGMHGLNDIMNSRGFEYITSVKKEVDINDYHNDYHMNEFDMISDHVLKNAGIAGYLSTRELEIANILKSSIEDSSGTDFSRISTEHVYRDWSRSPGSSSTRSPGSSCARSPGSSCARSIIQKLGDSRKHSKSSTPEKEFFSSQSTQSRSMGDERGLLINLFDDDIMEESDTTHNLERTPINYDYKKGGLMTETCIDLLRLYNKVNGTSEEREEESQLNYTGSPYKESELGNGDSCALHSEELIEMRMKLQFLQRMEISAWFASKDKSQETPWDLSSELRKGNYEEWLLEYFFGGKRKSSLTADGRMELSKMIAVVQKWCQIDIPEGHNEKYRTVRVTKDPVPTLHRPVVMYIWTHLLAPFVTTIVMKYFKFHAHRCGTLGYWYRKGYSNNNNSNKPPIIFCHGVGVGLLPYLPLIKDLCDMNIINEMNTSLATLGGRDIFCVNIPHIAMKFGIVSLPSSRELGVCVEDMLLAHYGDTPVTEYRKETEISSDTFPPINDASLSHKRTHPFHLVGHSFGCIFSKWVLKQCGNDVLSWTLIDPVNFLLFKVDLLNNVLHKEMKTFFGVLTSYFCFRETFMANTFCRNFFWHQNNIWLEDLREIPTHITLCGDDELLPAHSILRLVEIEKADREDQTIPRPKGGFRSLHVNWLENRFHGEPIVRPHLRSGVCSGLLQVIKESEEMIQ